jgi:hypothetical protein
MPRDFFWTHCSDFISHGGLNLIGVLMLGDTALVSIKHGVAKYGRKASFETVRHVSGHFHTWP